MMEISNKLINELTDIDFWIAAIVLIIVPARWWYLNKTKRVEQKIAVTAHVKQGNQKGTVPLADLEVTPKSDPNYGAVREYAVWFANQ